MSSKLTTPISISLNIHGQTYKVENIDWDADADTLREEFLGLLVAAGFTPSVMSDEYGTWTWVENVDPIND